MELKCSHVNFRHTIGTDPFSFWNIYFVNAIVDCRHNYLQCIRLENRALISLISPSLFHSHLENRQVQNSIQTGAKMCIDYFKLGFENFSIIFSPYKIYCAEHSTCQFYCKELNTSNTLFTSYLAWCESQKLCNR